MRFVDVQLETALYQTRESRSKTSSPLDRFLAYCWMAFRQGIQTTVDYCGSSFPLQPAYSFEDLSRREDPAQIIRKHDGSTKMQRRTCAPQILDELSFRHSHPSGFQQKRKVLLPSRMITSSPKCADRCVLELGQCPWLAQRVAQLLKSPPRGFEAKGDLLMDLHTIEDKEID